MTFFAAAQNVCLWAQSGHPDRVGECLLSEVNRTSMGQALIKTLQGQSQEALDRQL